MLAAARRGSRAVAQLGIQKKSFGVPHTDDEY